MSKQEVFAAQAAFEGSLATYEAFRADNVELIEQHEHLALALNEALEVLKTALRDNNTLVGKQFGGFSISVPREYDYDALKAALGDEAAAYTKTTYSVDSKAFEEAVKAAIIPQEVAAAVVGKGTPRVSGGPKPPSIFQR